MDKFIKFLFAVLCIVCMQAVQAGKDPIKWELDNTFPAEVVIGSGLYTVTYTLTNELPFTLVKPLVIDKSATPSSEFTYDDQCTGERLSPQEKCTVAITLVPVASGKKTVQITIAGYSSNRVPLPVLTTATPGSGGGAGTITVSTTTALPSTMVVGVGQPFAFTFTNTSSTVAATLVNVTGATAGTCETLTDATLAAGGTCTATGTFTPTSATPASQSATATLTYAEGNPVTGSSSTTVSAAATFVGVVSYPFPVNTTVAQLPINVGFHFTNNTASTITLTPFAAPYDSNHVKVTGGNGVATFTKNTTTIPTGRTTPIVDQCDTVTTLAPTQACDIYGTINGATASATPYVVEAKIFSPSPGNDASTSTTTTVVSSLPTTRTFTIKNSCDFPVWYSLAGGAIGSGTACATDSNCTAPLTCNTTSKVCQLTCNPALSDASQCGNVGGVVTGQCSSAGSCFWKNFRDTGFATNEMAANTTRTVTIPAASNSIGGLANVNTQWSGGISASTLCSGSTCGQADCEAGATQQSCKVGKGFLAPVTQAEFTLLITGADTYDVEVIDGFHVPVSMKPDVPSYAVDGYSCGTPGSLAGSSGFSGCNWVNYSPLEVISGETLPASQNQQVFYWVDQTGASTCTGNTCASGFLCGLDKTITKRCGKYLGIWTANRACAVSPTNAQPYFNCTTLLSTLAPNAGFTPSTATLSNLYGCTPPSNSGFGTCYTGYASANPRCCGCANWLNLGTTSPTPATTCQTYNSGGNVDPTWVSQIEPALSRLKKACPNVYTYPFDDKTSTFTCTNTLSTSANSTGYTIEFCEGGNTGLPTTPGTPLEGRG